MRKRLPHVSAASLLGTLALYLVLVSSAGAAPIGGCPRGLRPRYGWSLVIAVAVLAVSPAISSARSFGPFATLLGKTGVLSVAGAAAAPGTATSMAAPCAFVWPDTLQSCSSTYPAVKVESRSEGDTSGCTFGGTVDWGDGSMPEQFSFPGGPDGTIFDFADHTYSASGTYEISVAGSVLSGFCGWGNFVVSFTLNNVDPTSTTVACSPSSVASESAGACTATVTDTPASGASTPTGTVGFESSPDSGSFGDSDNCTLAATGTTGTASCQIVFTSAAPGLYRITGI